MFLTLTSMSLKCSVSLDEHQTRPYNLVMKVIFDILERLNPFK